METGVIEIKIREEDEFIKLGQALKKAGLADSGVDAKEAILDGLVKVNGDVATQRGKKLYGGEIITYNGETVKVEK
jgi:ribosome-associated protein